MGPPGPPGPPGEISYGYDVASFATLFGKFFFYSFYIFNFYLILKVFFYNDL